MKNSFYDLSICIKSLFSWSVLESILFFILLTICLLALGWSKTLHNVIQIICIRMLVWMNNCHSLPWMFGASYHDEVYFPCEQKSQFVVQLWLCALVTVRLMAIQVIKILVSLLCLELRWAVLMIPVFDIRPILNSHKRILFFRTSHCWIQMIAILVVNFVAGSWILIGTEFIHELHSCSILFESTVVICKVMMPVGELVTGMCWW